MRHIFAASLAALGTVFAVTAYAVDPPREVEVTGTRIALADLVGDTTDGAASVDLGVAPSAGGTRLFTRTELHQAWRAQHGDLAPPPRLPASVRVTRKALRLGVGEQKRIVERGLGGLPAGVRVDAVKPRARALVPAGWQTSKVAIGPLPPHAGAFRTTAQVELGQDGEVVARLAIPVELTVADEAVRPDLVRGGPLVVVVRRGDVEIAAAAVANADGRVGDVVQVTLRATRRVLRVTLVAADRGLLEVAP